jgi:hypothetical protein
MLVLPLTRKEILAMTGSLAAGFKHSQCRGQREIATSRGKVGNGSINDFQVEKSQVDICVTAALVYGMKPMQELAVGVVADCAT